ncbi:MAG: hypothetical protein PHX04_05645 [Bacilli bacterium]|nr:hypothetical protein [Bacilli bacterium]
MGYRSDVRIVTSQKAYRELQEYVEKYLAKDKDLEVDNLLECTDINITGKNGILIGWNGIKWCEYCDFKGVDAISAGLKNLRIKEYSFRFARFGDDYGDYEEIYHDGNDNKANYLPFVSLNRSFDDDEIIRDLDYLAKQKEKAGIEI